MKEVTDISGQRILIAVLNWGQGHVFRSIALIFKLLKQNNTVIIACNLQQKKIFTHYFKETVSFEFLEGYSFLFSDKRTVFFQNLGQFKQLLKQHRTDCLTCKKIVLEKNIDLVISDHRYGFHAPKAKNIFLTHQCRLPTQNFLLQKMHQRLIQKNFNTVWIVDDAENSFAGKLSQAKGFNNFLFLGAISRFENIKNNSSKDKLVAVISGPFPYNQLLLDAVKSLAEKQQKQIYCITDLPVNSGLLTAVPLEKQDAVLQQASVIISHSGYTTLLDLHFLQTTKVILIPSPQQTEQLYLAKIHREKYEVLKTYSDLLAVSV